MQKLYEIISETNRKTERKARSSLVPGMQHEQPNTAQYQDSPVCLGYLYVPLGRVIP